MNWPLSSVLWVTYVESVVPVVPRCPPNICRDCSNMAYFISDIKISLFFYFGVSPVVVLSICF